MSGAGREQKKTESEMGSGGEAPKAPAALPPSTNRGVGVSIHWLAITFFKGPTHAMELVLDKLFGVKLDNRMDWSNHFYLKPNGARGYRAMWAGPEGTRLYGFPAAGEHCHCEIPGSVLEKRAPMVVLDLLRGLIVFEYEWRVTRIDIAFDGVPFTPHDCRKAWELGNVRTKAHRDSWSWRDSEGGATFYIGSRKSERMIRVYDRRGPTRLELELKGDWANSAANMIAASSNVHWLWNCLGIIRDFVDFQYADGRGGKADPDLLPWWQSFVSGAEKAELRRPGRAAGNELDRLRRFVDKVLPSIYMVQEVDGVDFSALLWDCEWNLTPAQEAKLGRLRALKGEK